MQSTLEAPEAKTISLESQTSKSHSYSVQVARILAALRMDMDSLIAGLLHDTVEDNPHVASFEEIEVISLYRLESLFCS